MAEKIKKHHANVWLLNTGWIGGRYGVGKRISINDTRKIIDAIHDGSLQKANYAEMPIFRLQVPQQINGINSEILNPRNNWMNKEEYDTYLRKVAELFTTNFKRFQKGVNQAARDAGPTI